MSTNDMIKIREATNSDIKKIIAFHNNIYNYQRTPEQWMWEYKGCYPEFSIFTVIVSRGSIVGTLGMIPIYLNLNGKRHLSAKGENALLAPEYRGGTLFQQLSQFTTSLCETKNIICRWGITPGLKVWRNKLGFAVYDKCLYEFYLIVNLKNTFLAILRSKRNLTKKILTLFLVVLSYYYSLLLRIITLFKKKSSEKKYSIENKYRSINDIKSLYDSLRNQNPGLIHIDQDEKYLRWRIYNNPTIKYETYFLYENGHLKAYAYTHRDQSKRVYLTDFTFENREAGTSLLQKLIANWHQQKVSYVTYLGNIKNSLIRTTLNLLKGFGFFRQGKSTPFVIKNILYDQEDYLLDIKKWEVNALWTEGYKF